MTQHDRARWGSTIGLAIVVALITGTCRGATPGYTLQLSLGTTRVEGTPLTWNQSQVLLLGRDGRLWDFSPDAAGEVRKSSPTFHSYSVGEIREQLQRELGNQFELTPTGHYLVAHPKGQRDLWGERFETLYRTFIHYFSARGLRPTQPEFPLVALVFAKQADFIRYAQRDQQQVGASVLGYYSPTTNRVALFDQTDQAAGWEETAATIIHEATHQTAFNTGVHNRFGYTPRWVAEGLGTLFEAPGVWNWRAKSSQHDRVNRDRLTSFRHYANTRRQPGAMAEIVARDRLFDVDADAAYAEAWAVTYYLVETQGKKYGEFLARTAARPNFETYDAATRTADFVKTFGDNWAMLESHFLRFMATTK